MAGETGRTVPLFVKLVYDSTTENRTVKEHRDKHGCALERQSKFCMAGAAYHARGSRRHTNRMEGHGCGSCFVAPLGSPRLERYSATLSAFHSGTVLADSQHGAHDRCA